MNIEVTKRCPRCGWTLPVGEFAVDRHKAGGRKSWCLVCDRRRARDYYAANRVAVLARQRAARS